MILTPGNCSVKMSRYGERDSERKRTTTGHGPHRSGERGIDGARAAERLSLSERQTKRLLAGFRREGVAALVHGNRGRQPAHTLSPGAAGAGAWLGDGEVCRLQSGAFDRTIGRREGIALSRSSVRRILGAAGIGSPRTRRAPQHRSRRARYPQAGMLVQIDASPHDWLEGRGPRLTLFAAIDDATGEVLALLFRAQEDAHGYFLLVRMIVTTHGRPARVVPRPAQHLPGQCAGDDGGGAVGGRAGADAVRAIAR